MKRPSITKCLPTIYNEMSQGLRDRIAVVLRLGLWKEACNEFGVRRCRAVAYCGHIPIPQEAINYIYFYGPYD